MEDQLSYYNIPINQLRRVFETYNKEKEPHQTIETRKGRKLELVRENRRNTESIKGQCCHDDAKGPHHSVLVKSTMSGGKKFENSALVFS